MLTDAVLAPVYVSQTHDIQIVFGSSLDKATYTLYDKPIWAVWIQGSIKSVETDHRIIEVTDSSGKILQIEVDFDALHAFNKLTGFELKKDSPVCLICRVSHIIIDSNAYIRFKLDKINNITEIELSAWDHIVLYINLDINLEL